MNKIFYMYIARNDSLANNLTAEEQINIDSDSDFIVTEIRTTGTDGVFITISNSNGNQYSSSSFNSSFIGKGENKLVLPEVWVIPANSKLKVQFNNTSGGTLTNLEVELIGYKVFK